MTISELTELTANLLIRYYDNDIQPFLDYLDKDALWIGPAQNQIIRSKEALVEAFGMEQNTERLNAVAERMPGSMLRCHSSYLVNPMYVESIERFALTLSDGSRIPIPEKKYTAVKDLLLHK